MCPPPLPVRRNLRALHLPGPRLPDQHLLGQHLLGQHFLDPHPHLPHLYLPRLGIPRLHLPLGALFHLPLRSNHLHSRDQQQPLLSLSLRLYLLNLHHSSRRHHQCNSHLLQTP